MESLAAFYDGCRGRFLADYDVRNERVVRALEFADQHLTHACDRILDIGCGIGWTTTHLARGGAEVVGIDLSPVLIDTARAMFGTRGGHYTFIAGNILDTELDGVFDGVTMIDVYEHIPRDQRPRLHEKLAQHLEGGLLLTVPTPEALQWARDHDIPLQPVDEDVTDQDIDELADAIGGQVLFNERIEIWRPNDYRHVLIRNA